MNKKLALKFFISMMALSRLCVGHVSAYSPMAFMRAINSANQDERVKYVFTDYIPTVRVSMFLGVRNGIHSIKNYCWFLDCTKEELTQFLDGTPLDDVMVEDFMRLANDVKVALEHR